MIALPKSASLQFLSCYCKRNSRITLLRGEKWNLQFLRLRSTAELPEKQDPEREKRKRKTKVRDSESLEEDLLAYFTSEKQRNTLGSFPPNYFNKKMNTPNHLYLADEAVARNIADCVAGSSSRDTSILEINPGCGVLTQQLLSATSQKIHLFESDEEFTKDLEKIVEKNPDRLSLKKEDLTALWRIAYQDKLDNGDRVQKLLDGKLPKRDWTEGNLVLPVLCSIWDLKIYSRRAQCQNRWSHWLWELLQASGEFFGLPEQPPNVRQMRNVPGRSSSHLHCKYIWNFTLKVF